MWLSKPTATFSFIKKKHPKFQNLQNFKDYFKDYCSCTKMPISCQQENEHKIQTTGEKVNSDISFYYWNKLSYNQRKTSKFLSC